MQETPQNQTKAQAKSSNALFLGVGALIAVAGIAVVLFLSNGNHENVQTATATNQTDDINGAVINLELADQLDDIAIEDLAAFIPTRKTIPRTDLAFNMPDGGATSLKDFKGKVTLVNLWATWCAPCRHEMPSFDRLQAELGSNVFEVITINVDRGEQGLEKAKDFFQEIGLQHLTLYHENDNKAFSYFTSKVGAYGLPATILVDHNGNELGKLNGAAEWDSERSKQLVQAALLATEQDLSTQ